MVPPCLAAASGCGSDSDGCDASPAAAAPSVAKAMDAGFLPALDEDRADMFTPSELRLYLHAQDYSLLTLHILGYPRLFGDILPRYQKLSPFEVDSGGSKRSHRPAAAARQPGVEINETYGMSSSEGISQDNSV